MRYGYGRTGRSESTPARAGTSEKVLAAAPGAIDILVGKLPGLRPWGQRICRRQGISRSS